MASSVPSLDAAQHYLNEPFTGPEPVDETGPNAHFRSTFDPIPGNTIKKEDAQSTSGSRTPKASHSRNASLEHKATAAHSRKVSGGGGGRSRGNSLNQRYPGDMSHHPLDMIKQDAKKAHRSPHLRKGSIPGIDSVDALDTVPGGAYHHGGPFDATLASRNQNRMHSPVAAVFDSNVQTLKATPSENIRNALDKHYPLDGVAQVAPGAMDRNGRTYDYDEADLPNEVDMDDKRYPGEEVNEQKKEIHRLEGGQAANKIVHDGGTTGIELADQSSKKHVDVVENEVEAEGSHGHHHRHSLGGLKKRIGSLRKKKD